MANFSKFGIIKPWNVINHFASSISRTIFNFITTPRGTDDISILWYEGYIRFHCIKIFECPISSFINLLRWNYIFIGAFLIIFQGKSIKSPFIPVVLSAAIKIVKFLWRLNMCFSISIKYNSLFFVLIYLDFWSISFNNIGYYYFVHSLLDRKVTMVTFVKHWWKSRKCV